MEEDRIGNIRMKSYIFSSPVSRQETSKRVASGEMLSSARVYLVLTQNQSPFAAMVDA